MTIEKLNEIVSLMDLAKIDKALTENGYRNASKNGKWEFDPISIANANNVQNSERYEDVFFDKVYVGDIHLEVKEYPDIDFIVITVNNVYRDRDNLETPGEMLLYTTAPINEEYERRMSQIGTCELCKKQFPMDELCEINGKLVCDDCFSEDLKRFRLGKKSKLTQKIKFKRDKL